MLVMAKASQHFIMEHETTLPSAYEFCWKKGQMSLESVGEVERHFKKLRKTVKLLSY